MASQAQPKKGVAYTIYAVMLDSNGDIVSSPTIAAGDIKVQKDGAALANVATTPTPANGLVPIVLSATEMNADNIVVKAVDAAGDEWIDQAWVINTTTYNNNDIYPSLSGIGTTSSNAAVAAVTAQFYLQDWITNGVPLGNNTITAAKIAASAIGASELADDAIAKIAAGITYSVAAIAPDGALTGDRITIRAYDSFTVPLVVGSVSDRSELYFTVKSAETVADAAAAIHISEGTGLEYIAGGVAGTAANGDISVSDAATGAMTVTLDEVETAKLTAGTTYIYGVKKITSGGDAITLIEGPCTVKTAVVREVT